MGWIDSMLEFLHDYWEQAAAAVTAIAALLTYWKAKSLWRSRRFLSRVNFSLNYVDGSTLKIRTLDESELDRVLLGNRHGRRVVLRAARKTTAAQPFLAMPERDAWLVLNSVLNELSSRFAEGFLAVSMGVPTRSATFVLALTCEKHRDVRMNKLRVMIVEKSLLLEIDQYEDLKFERPSHHLRYQTLKAMRRLYLTPDSRFTLMEMEIAVPSGPA